MHALPQDLSGLLEEAAYAHPVKGLELIETHISWVLLTGQYAYKIKRPVCYPFLDMRDPQRRLELCREELRLNQRFAAELYLEVCPVVRRDGRARMGGAGEVIEHAVRMRQFPREEELDRLLADGKIEPSELRSFGAGLAAIHASLAQARHGSPWGDPARTRAAIRANFDQTIAVEAQHSGTDRVAALRTLLEARLAALEPWMAERWVSGKVRECHGDLHCGNVVRWDGALRAFDCLEFDPALRWMDVAQEISFLLADLQARDATAQARAFLAGYLAHSGDYEACRGLRLFQAHCSLVRAKVRGLSTQDGAAGPGFAEYAGTAAGLLEQPHPMLVVVMGLSGSGKTHLASRLAPLLGAIHVQSDVERRRLSGLESGGRSSAGLAAGIYAPANTERVYSHLAAVASLVLASGWSVIVDATFGKRVHRAQLQALARRIGVPLTFLVCHAPPQTLHDRVLQRAALGSDASEANTDVLAWQLRHSEPVTAGEQLLQLDVDTSVETDDAALVLLARRVRMRAEEPHAG